MQLPQAAAEMLVELVGPELGLLDQELAKLALLAGDEQKITPELVGRSAGGWRAKTTWEMLDAALDGNVREAMLQLDRLLASGEQPVGLLGQISASLRRFAAATRLVLAGRGRPPPRQSPRCPGAGRRPLVRAAKGRAATPPVGPPARAQLYRWLLQADLDLKGDSAMPPRLILERLIVRLAVRQGTGRKG